MFKWQSQHPIASWGRGAMVFRNARIVGPNIMIDCFTECHSAYILTHCHSDHMTGLKKGWCTAPLFCSPTTARLLRHLHGIHETVRPIELGAPFEFDGAVIEFVDANHIPGSVMVIIRRSGAVVVNTGDFRLNEEICKKLSGLAGSVEHVFFDNSWDAQWFPSKKESIDHVLALVDFMAENNDRDIVFQSCLGDEAILQALSTRTSRQFLFFDKQRYEELKQTHKDFLDGLDKRAPSAFKVVIVRNTQQRRQFHGLMIQCSVLWFVKDNRALAPCFDGEVWHVPFSMHSSGSEIKALLHILKPSRATPLCDVIHKSEARKDDDSEYEESAAEEMEASAEDLQAKKDEEREMKRMFDAITRSIAFYRAAVSPPKSESGSASESEHGEPEEVLDLLNCERPKPQRKRAKRS